MIIARIQDLREHSRFYKLGEYNIRFTQAYWREIPDDLMPIIETDIASGFLVTANIKVDKSKLKKEERPVFKDEKLNKFFPIKFFEKPKIAKQKDIVIESIRKVKIEPVESIAKESKKPGRPAKIKDEPNPQKKDKVKPEEKFPEMD